MKNFKTSVSRLQKYTENSIEWSKMRLERGRRTRSFRLCRVLVFELSMVKSY